MTNTIFDFNAFLLNIDRTESQDEPTRQKAYKNLLDFWQHDRGRKFSEYRERMQRIFNSYPPNKRH